MSARFPYITPAATVSFVSGQDKLRIIDGGFSDPASTYLGLALSRDVSKVVVSNQDFEDYFEVIYVPILSKDQALKHRRSVGDKFSELLSALRAMFSNRAVSWDREIERLEKIRTSSKMPFSIQPIYLVDGDSDPALGWILSESSFDIIDEKVEESLANANSQFCSLLRRIKGRRSAASC